MAALSDSHAEIFLVYLVPEQNYTLLPCPSSPFSDSRPSQDGPQALSPCTVGLSGLMGESGRGDLVVTLWVYQSTGDAVDHRASPWFPPIAGFAVDAPDLVLIRDNGNTVESLVLVSSVYIPVQMKCAFAP